MRFISYAQNAEDVMLWRAFRHIPNGFYIDVGANDPVEDSVTLALYERGWRGINIEPVPRHYTDLVAQRPEDINLCCAAGALPGSFTLYEVTTMRGWGTLDATMAAQYRQQGHRIEEIPVTVTPLSEICGRHVAGEIHFLKVDVEGAEEQVFKGMDFSRWRPWVVIAESRIPTADGLVKASWEELLLQNRYTEAYFDGVNTFYLADEHYNKLHQAFTAPPNIMDDYVRHSEWQAGRYAEELENKHEQLQQYARSLEQQVEQLAAYEQQLVALYASTSWKVTAPLRAVRRLLPQAASEAPRLPGKLLRAVARQAEATPVLKGLARRGLQHLPGIKGKLRQFAAGAAPEVSPAATDPVRASLSADAREIYDTLIRRDMQ